MSDPLSSRPYPESYIRVPTVQVPEPRQRQAPSLPPKFYISLPTGQVAPVVPALAKLLATVGGQPNESNEWAKSASAGKMQLLKLPTDRVTHASLSALRELLGTIGFSNQDIDAVSNDWTRLSCDNLNRLFSGTEKKLQEWGTAVHALGERGEEKPNQRQQLHEMLAAMQSRLQKNNYLESATLCPFDERQQVEKFNLGVAWLARETRAVANSPVPRIGIGF
jgi:hypothetical protein